MLLRSANQLEDTKYCQNQKDMKFPRKNKAVTFYTVTTKKTRKTAVTLESLIPRMDSSSMPKH